MMKALTLFFTRLICQYLLWLMGWQVTDNKKYDIIKNLKRCVAVYTHTSTWDFIILFLYVGAYPELGYRVRTLAKPQLFEGWWGLKNYLMRKVGCLPATRLEERNGGSVSKIVAELRKCDEFMFLISPKGTTFKSKNWRTGYYYIARQLECDFVVIGLDYELNTISLETGIKLEEYSKTEATLKEKLSQIVPLYPELESIPIRKYTRVRAFNIARVIAFIIAQIVGVKVLIFSLTLLYELMTWNKLFLFSCYFIYKSLIH